MRYNEVGHVISADQCYIKINGTALLDDSRQQSIYLRKSGIL